MDWRNKNILITGGTGMLGHALINELRKENCTNLSIIGSRDFDLRDSDTVDKLFRFVRPQYVFHLAAKVYGLGGNAFHKSEVLYDNVMINTNVIEACRRYEVTKIVAMGSGCVYPELAKGCTLREDQIWSGPPHPSEDSYAHAKRLMLAQLIANKEQYGLNFSYAVSGNLYGEHDKFTRDTGHVIPSLIYKFYQASQQNTPVIAWGTGAAIRDFTHSSDAARALILLMDQHSGVINLGSGFIHSIKNIVDCLQEITGVQVGWDINKSDGQLERYYDLGQLKSLGFEAKMTLKEGLDKVYNWYYQNMKRQGIR